MTNRPFDTVDIDARGLENPAALIHVAKATRYLSKGTRVVVHATDEHAAIDFPAWADWAGHAIEPIEPDPDGGYMVRLTVLSGNGKAQRAIEDSLATQRRALF